MTTTLHWLADTTVSLSLLLALLLLIRRPVARHIGAVTAYRLWLLVPLHLAIPFLFPEALFVYQVQLAPFTIQPDNATPVMNDAIAYIRPIAVLVWVSGLACAVFWRFKPARKDGGPFRCRRNKPSTSSSTEHLMAAPAKHPASGRAFRERFIVQPGSGISLLLSRAIP